MSKFTATIPREEIAKFCRRWKVRELALFGSALRDDFGPDSDVDVLVTFAEGGEWGLFDHIQMQNELQTALRRNVDLVSRRAVERSHNWLRRQEILNTAQVFFAAQGFKDWGSSLLLTLNTSLWYQVNHGEAAPDSMPRRLVPRNEPRQAGGACFPWPARLLLLR